MKIMHHKIICQSIVLLKPACDKMLPCLIDNFVANKTEKKWSSLLPRSKTNLLFKKANFKTSKKKQIWS